MNTEFVTIKLDTIWIFARALGDELLGHAAQSQGTRTDRTDGRLLRCLHGFLIDNCNHWVATPSERSAPAGPVNNISKLGRLLEECIDSRNFVKVECGGSPDFELLSA